MTMQKIEAASQEAQSANLAAGNLAQLKALFPELVAEGPSGPAVNVDVLKALVGDITVTDADERFGDGIDEKEHRREKHEDEVEPIEVPGRLLQARTVPLHASHHRVDANPHRERDEGDQFEVEQHVFGGDLVVQGGTTARLDPHR